MGYILYILYILHILHILKKAVALVGLKIMVAK
jgi:hypothetical protein